MSLVPARQSTHIRCEECQSEFDALKAEECSCVTRDHTIICPHCKRCACGTSVAARQRFWRTAPAALWQKRVQRNKLDHKRPVQNSQLPAPLTGDEKPLVMIADDSRVIRMMVRQVVEQAGCSVIDAQDGSEALELAQTMKPKLLIADALMPKLGARMGRAKAPAVTSRLIAWKLTGDVAGSAIAVAGIPRE